MTPPPSGERVFITGGAGFIGSALAARLLPENEVVIFDSFARDALSRSGLEGSPNLVICKGDVLDAPALATAMAGATMVVHCAAVAGVGVVRSAPVRVMRTNLLGALHTLEAAADLPGLRRVIQLSTSEVYGSFAENSAEDHNTSVGPAGEPRWSYAVSKLCIDHLASALHQERGLPVVSVRPFNVYGPGQVGEGAIQRFVGEALAGRPLQIRGDGAQVRAWCYIDDFVDGLLACLGRPEAVGQTLNLGNPRAAVSVRALAEAVRRLAGGGPPLRFVPGEGPDVELRIPDICKAERLLGFAPKVDLEEGLVRTLAWARARAQP